MSLLINEGEPLAWLLNVEVTSALNKYCEVLHKQILYINSAIWLSFVQYASLSKLWEGWF